MSRDYNKVYLQITDHRKHARESIYEDVGILLNPYMEARVFKTIDRNVGVSLSHCYSYMCVYFRRFHNLSEMSTT